jgi:hypothetical protein
MGDEELGQTEPGRCLALVLWELGAGDQGVNNCQRDCWSFEQGCRYDENEPYR